MRRPVEVGRQTGLYAQILSGLEEGAAVVVQPSNDIEEGARVEPREGGYQLRERRCGMELDVWEYGRS